jgi:DNA repair protein RecN (Recombination protein N)
MVEALDGDEGSALSALGLADRALSTLEKGDPSASAWRELLDGAFTNLGELARLAGEYAESIQEDPGRLAEVERRRDLIFRLGQKHGAGIEAILEARRLAGEELDLLDTADTDLRALGARRTAAEAALSAAAAALSAKRRQAGDQLARAVSRLLPNLGLSGGKLGVELVPLKEPSSFGQESVTFTVRLNVGLEAKPLAKVASGGELSRLMLALKVVLVRHDAIPTLIFDEVDQGIGGEVGVQVGDALAAVADRRQVLVITHLPQIAARADRHLFVSKAPRSGMATSEVTLIHGEDRIVELARMLGDPDGREARRHAQALLGKTKTERST